MHPVLFELTAFGGITINSYGVMVAIGFLLGIAWVSYESKRLGENPSRNLDLMFYILVAALVGSRVFHVLISEREAFLANPLMIFRVWRGGLVFYGGFIASLLVSAWFIRRHKMGFLKTSDIFVPGIALGHAVGRIGCFLAGCCYGRACDADKWFAVVFPKNANSFAPAGVPLYPTQLMESAGELSIFIILFVLRYFKKFDGQIFSAYLMLYAVLRYALEFFRGDAARGFVVDSWLSTSQFISLLIFMTGLVSMLIARSMSKAGGLR